MHNPVSCKSLENHICLCPWPAVWLWHLGNAVAVCPGHLCGPQDTVANPLHDGYRHGASVLVGLPLQAGHTRLRRRAAPTGRLHDRKENGKETLSQSAHGTGMSCVVGKKWFLCGLTLLFLPKAL